MPPFTINHYRQEREAKRTLKIARLAAYVATALFVNLWYVIFVSLF